MVGAYVWPLHGTKKLVSGRTFAICSLLDGGAPTLAAADADLWTLAGCVAVESMGGEGGWRRGCTLGSARLAPHFSAVWVMRGRHA